MNARDIEIAVANHFNARVNVIVPNISWGLFSNREVDVLVVRPSGFAVEVEIKTNAADIKRDLKKRRHLIDRRGWHEDRDKIREKYFAVPVALKDHPDIPADCGILAVTEGYSWPKVIRRSKLNKNARRLTPSEIHHVMELGLMRIWTLKAALQKASRKQTPSPQPEIPAQIS
jgi:hypothetical protein